MSYQQPVDPLNRLRAYMDFYDQNNLAPRDYSAHSGFNPSPTDPNADRMRWAQQMLQQEQGQRQEPDYFDFGNDQRPQNRLLAQAPQQVSPIANFDALRASLPNRLLMFKGGR